ncbi:DUF2381 family protein, partial [Archangium sp.]|uniref:DUF2381 family protein n=1 Tax=Archangium sp. TaxID=1872627 RepID=UPI00286C2E90
LNPALACLHLHNPPPPPRLGMGDCFRPSLHFLIALCSGEGFIDCSSASIWRAEGRVAVDVRLWNPGTRPWVAEGAVLRGAKGEVIKPLPLWQSAPVEPGSKPGRVVVEVLASEVEARGTYTLTLWDAEQKRTVTLGHVTFP